MVPTTLTDLPPELIDHITTYLPTASSLAHLGVVSKYLHKCIESDGWSTFNRSRFPSLHPQTLHSSQHVARTLTTLSRAWDRRAFVARVLEPQDILAFPGARKLDRWRRPRGQTIGFTPHLDVIEHVGPAWRDRREVLAFSAGAELCLRDQRGDDVKWMTYRRAGASEGRDDITTLHLLRQPEKRGLDGQQLLVGTANGDLTLLDLPTEQEPNATVTHFATQGQPVRSSSILEQAHGNSLLVANMGDSRVSLYPLVQSTSQVVPISSIDVRPPQSGGVSVKNQRVWSTKFLSPSHLAVGLGPSDEPLQIYTVTPTGISHQPTRTFALLNDLDALVEGNVPMAASFSTNITSSIYPIVPLPHSTTAGSNGNVFLSGAYDGIVRLHDLRSPSQVEQAYVDPTDDSAIYSLLPRGQETLLAGTARHSLLKVFDMRMGSKCYTYLDAKPAKLDKQRDPRSTDWSLFLRPSNHQQAQHAWGANRHRSSETSIYSLASPSPSSPYVYAGLENSVLELAFTGVLDKHPDSAFFPDSFQSSRHAEEAQRKRQVIDLAMHDQSAASLKLYTQKSLGETVRRSSRGSAVAHTLDFPRCEEALDERWKVGGS